MRRFLSNSTRQPFLLICALIAVCGSLTAALATTSQRDYDLRGYADPTRTADLPFHLPRLGVNTELTQYSSDELSRQFALMQDAHIHWVRQFVRWDMIEPIQGEYDWSQWDRIVETITTTDLQLVAVLFGTPAWNRANPDLPASAPPDDPAVFAAFASAFAKRYGNRIDHYQIWDEPNLTEAWGGLDPKPAEYAALLKAAYDAIHDADSDAEVIAAALAPTAETGPRNINDWLYLRDLYALGAHDYADGFAGKPYGFDTSPLDREITPPELNFSRFVGLREAMLQQNDGKTALWASNWGWNSLPPDWTGEPSIWGSVDEATRIRYTLEALDRAEREWTWLGGFILYHWQPDAPTNDPIWGFALIGQDDQPTALYTALVNRKPQTTAMDGLYPAANPYTRYSGVWTFSPLGADIGWLRDSRFAFDFAGGEIALLLRKGNYVGYLYPTLKTNGRGVTINAVPQDAAGNPYIILTSGSLNPEITLVPIAHDLPLQPYTLEAVADRGYDQYALVGYAVSSGDLAAPYNRQIAVAWFTVIASLIATIIMGWGIDWRTALNPLTQIWTSLNVIQQFIISIVTSIALMIGFLLTWGEAAPALFRRDSVQLGLSLVTAGLIYLNPALPLTIAAGLILFIVLYQRPQFGLALIIFYAPFFLFPVELYRFAFPMAELLTLLTFSAFSLRLLNQWGRYRQSGVSQSPIRLNWTWHPLDYLMLIWVGLGILSLTWAAQKAPAMTELRTLMIEPTLLYLMFRTLRLNHADVLRIVDALLAAAFIVCLVGLLLYIRGEGIITAEDSARRLASVYGSPNNVALLLGRCIPFALAFTLIRVDTLRQRVAAGLCGFMLITAILTQSVGGLFIGIPFSVAVVILMIYRRRALLPLSVVLVIVIVGFVVGASLSERFSRALDFTQGTNFYRVRVWQSTFNILREHPIIGLGLDQFLYVFRGQYIYPDAWEEPNLSHPHNILLDFWVRLGVGGVILLFAHIVTIWTSIQRPLPHIKTDRLMLALWVGTTGSFVNLIAHGLIDNSIFVLDLAYIFMLLQALMVYLSITPLQFSSNP